MNLKRVRPLLLCILPASLPLLAACSAPGDVGAEGPDTEGSVGVATQAAVTSTKISGSCAASLALRPDGTVWSSGDNLGDGTSTDRTSPVQVGGLSDVTAVAEGTGASNADDALALRSDGTLWAWGSNDSGQLGDGTTTSRLSPVQVGGLSGVTAMAAGSSAYSLALTSDGTAWAWGPISSASSATGTRRPGARRRRSAGSRASRRCRRGTSTGSR